MSKGLFFLPLGGVGEIGANCYLYGIKDGDYEEWIMVDLGIGFTDNSSKAVDVIIPDIRFIKEKLETLKGIVITHAHEDHIGALSYLWPDLKHTIYTNKFTSDIISRKMGKNGVKKPKIEMIQQFEPFKLGSFEITMIPIQHSVPDSTMLIIDSPYGRVVHSGDFKYDAQPTLGTPLDEEFLENKIKEKQPIALFCDSTNILNKKQTLPEYSIAKDLEEIIAEHDKGLFVTLFSSNVARMNLLFEIAEKVGRDVVLLSNAMNLYYDIAQSNNEFKSKLKPLPETALKTHAKEKLMILCSGSQAENRSQLWQTLMAGSKMIKIEEGDMVLFSSKVIPGNERKLALMYGALFDLGARVVTAGDYNVHVSGHPAQEDVKWLYNLVKPKYVVPIHGEALHLDKHKRFAIENGYKSIVTKDGDMLQLSNGSEDFKPRIVSKIALEFDCVDGNRIISTQSEILKERVRVLYHGAATVSMVINKKGRLVAEPNITTFGILDESEEARIFEELHELIDTTTKTTNNNDEEIREAVRIAVRRFFTNLLDKKTVVSVHLFRVL